MRPRFALALVSAWMCACAGLLGLDDVRYGDGADGGARDASDEDASANEGDAAPRCPPPPRLGSGLCGGGLRDCVRDGVCDIDLSSDREHCGACNHSCRGRTCTNGACDPETIWTNAAGAHVVGVIRDATHVYWAEGALVRRAPFDGGLDTASTLLNTVGANWPDYPTGALAVDDAHVYCGIGIGVGVARIDGTEPRWFVEENAAIVSVGDRIVVSQPSGKIVAVEKDGGARIDLATGQPRPVALTTDGKTLFWLNEPRYGGNEDAGRGDLRKMSTAGGSAPVLATELPNPVAIAVDGAHVFWADDDTGEISRVGVEGGPAKVIAKSPDAERIVALAVDAEHVYWATQERSGPGYGGIYKASRCGDGPQRIVVAAYAATPIMLELRGLVLEDGFVYFGSADGNIHRVAK